MCIYQTNTNLLYSTNKMNTKHKGTLNTISPQIISASTVLSKYKGTYDTISPENMSESEVFTLLHTIIQYCSALLGVHTKYIGTLWMQYRLRKFHWMK